MLVREEPTGSSRVAEVRKVPLMSWNSIAGNTRGRAAKRFARDRYHLVGAEPAILGGNKSSVGGLTDE